MNIQKFIFKLFVILTYIVRVALLIFPIAAIIVIGKEGGWKYGFTFIQNNIDVAIFISFALGFLFSLYHAVSFEGIGEGPIQNYLKTKQKVAVTGKVELNELYERLADCSDINFKELNLVGDSIRAKVRVSIPITLIGRGFRLYKFLIGVTPPDTMIIEKSGDEFRITSKPFTFLFFIDFGRNFKRVTKVAKLIKGIK